MFGFISDILALEPEKKQRLGAGKREVPSL